MRTRLVLGGVAAALAVSAAAPAQAQPVPERRCYGPTAVVCTVLCIATKACP